MNIMKQVLITDFFKKELESVYIDKQKEECVIKIDCEKIYGYNKDTGNWHCIECGENMGSNNSRQLCGKSYCYNFC